MFDVVRRRAADHVLLDGVAADVNAHASAANVQNEMQWRRRCRLDHLRRRSLEMVVHALRRTRIAAYVVVCSFVYLDSGQRSTSLRWRVVMLVFVFL